MKIGIGMAVGSFVFALSMGALAQTVPSAVRLAEDSVDPEKIRAHVRFLADDLLEGRYPGLRGGDLAAKYIATQFALDGLKPAGDDGTYLQWIDFVGMKAIADRTSFALVPARGGAIPLKFADDYTVQNQKLTPSVDLDAPIVAVSQQRRPSPKRIPNR